MVSARPKGRPAGSKTKKRNVNLRAVIRSGVIYPKQVFLGITGWGEKSFLEAIDLGLRVVTFGGRSSVVGDDYLAWMRSQDRNTRQPKSCPPETSRSMSAA